MRKYSFIEKKPETRLADIIDSGFKDLMIQDYRTNTIDRLIIMNYLYPTHKLELKRDGTGFIHEVQVPYWSNKTNSFESYGNSISSVRDAIHKFQNIWYTWIFNETSCKSLLNSTVVDVYVDRIKTYKHYRKYNVIIHVM